MVNDFFLLFLRNCKIKEAESGLLVEFTSLIAMRNILFLLSCCLLWNLTSVYAQCEYPIDSIDEFDSTRLVAYEPINIGYMIPSKVETDKGPLMIEEAKLMFTFSQNDTLDAFFLTLAVPEYEYHSIKEGFNVLFKLNNEQIIPLLNFPDQGNFNRKTNMRIYQHTLVVPLDLFYNLTHHTIERIRINYPNRKHTITLSPKQQEEVREAVRCIGKAVALFPIKP